MLNTVLVAFALLPLLARYRNKRGFPEKCQVVALYLYPVKGLQGYEVESAVCLERGFEHDRRFMIIDTTRENAFCTQREYPSMARVKARILASGTELQLKSGGGKDAGNGEITVTNWSAADKARLTVRVWDSICHNAVDQGQEVADWLQRELGGGAGVEARFRLVYMAEDCHRAGNPKATSKDQEFEVSFADAYPYLVASVSSLEDLNARLAAAGSDTIPMSRFRPSIVVQGLAPWTEDREGTELYFNNGEFALKFIKPCDRCKVTTIDQVTGQISAQREPLKTLQSFRQIYNTALVFFATNAVLLNKSSNKPARHVMRAGQVSIKWF